ncbi:FtsX-like permease family protein [Clostridiales bacterium COT073_COT-073]|nr:FtsX-like permease family protein [Clostridiales bacterium COT073_COT-073]
MKIALLKDIYREIRYSLPRFLSIMLMISLGVFVYSGLKGSAPLMRNTMNDFTTKTNMADLKIETILGLDRKDMSLILSGQDISTAEFHYSVDLNTADSDLLIQLQSLPKTISIPYLTAGRLPENANEILLDHSLQAKGYQIGQVISFKKEISKFRFRTDEQENTLKRYKFQITGFCYHPEFTNPNLKREASDGLGKLDGFAFISEKNFNSDDYRFARLKLNQADGLTSESPIYKEITSNYKKNLRTVLIGRPKLRLRDLKKEAMDQIRDNEKKLTDAQRQIKDARNQLDLANRELTDGEDQLDRQKKNLANQIQKAESDIQKAENQLNLAKSNLDQGLAAYHLEKSEWENGKKQYSEGHLALINGKTQLKQEQDKLQKNLDQLEIGISQIEKALMELDAAEKQLFSALSALGITPDAFKLKVSTAVKNNQTSLIEAMGDAAVNYAAIIQNRQKLLLQKKELLRNQQKIQVSLKMIADELVKLEPKEMDLKKIKSTLDLAEIALRNAKADLDKGQAEYKLGIEKLELSRRDLTSQVNSAWEKINQAETELTKARQKYEDGKDKFEEEEKEANDKIADGKAKIADAKKILKALKEPAYKIQTRDDLSQYYLYYDSAQRMEFLSNIFPVFFFLIAMLVCLSTMTRMAEEHRGQIGTLKALGYNNWDISKKYFYYGLFSSVIGGIIGVCLGQPILSRAVYSAYNDIFIFQKPFFKMFWQYNIISVLIGIACTALVAFIVVNKHLHFNAAALMRPKAPKNGTKIALERIIFIWKRMSFLQKVTARNMFRYKARMLMAILGISGCTSLVFLGFALRDSVSHLLPIQFEQLTHYQYMVIYDEDLSESAAADFRTYLKKTSAIRQSSTIYLESADWNKKGLSTQTIQMIIPQNPQDFLELQTLRSPENTKKTFTLPKEGAILTDKLAKLAQVKVGDTLEVIDEDNRKIQILIAAISENYLGHYLYMSKNYYTRLFGENPAWNAKAILLNSDQDINEDTFISELLDFDVVLSVAETNFASASQSLESLDIVVGIMILLSSLLAFVVLYNLSNINISERMRELSTIKVLGFFPQELTAYVYRETFSLSIIGIGLGYILGILLHKMILEVIVPDAFQLYAKIFPMTYLIAAIMTLIFSVIVMIFVHFRLKRIDMVEALKSYE